MGSRCSSMCTNRDSTASLGMRQITGTSAGDRRTTDEFDVKVSSRLGGGEATDGEKICTRGWAANGTNQEGTASVEME